MINGINKFNQYFYWLLISIPALMLLISIVSYLSVYSTFGTVPPSRDYTAELIGNSGKNFWIVPESIGLLVIMTYIYSTIIALIFSPLLLFIKYFNSNVRFHRKLTLTLISVHFITFLLSLTGSWTGWYMQYLLD
jgi:hypothetical protein